MLNTQFDEKDQPIDFRTTRGSLRHDAVEFADVFKVSRAETQKLDSESEPVTQTEKEDEDEEQKLEGPMTREQHDKANATERRKLSKYNNLYDRLRKKRDELQVLFAQRKFLSLAFEQQNKPDYLLKISNIVLS